VDEHVVIALVGLNWLHIRSGTGELVEWQTARESHSFPFSSRRACEKRFVTFAERLIILSNCLSRENVRYPGGACQ
jgi:hypothetical protein